MLPTIYSTPSFKYKYQEIWWIASYTVSRLQFVGRPLFVGQQNRFPHPSEGRYATLSKNIVVNSQAWTWH